MKIGQDIAEYAVMLAVILVILVGTVRMVGSYGTSTQFALVTAGDACLLGLAAAGPESRVLALPAGTGLRHCPAVSGGFSVR